MKTKRKQDENLIPFNKRSESEARESGRKGGKKSGEVRREKKTMREWLELAFAMSKKDKDGNPEKSEADPRRNLTLKEAAMAELAKQAAGGDLKAIEQAVKILGESETKLVVETVSPAEKLAELISEARKK